MLFVFSVPLSDLRHEVQARRPEEVHRAPAEGALDRRHAELRQVWQDWLHESHALPRAQEQLQGRKALENNLQYYQYMYGLLKNYAPKEPSML